MLMGQGEVQLVSGGSKGQDTAHGAEVNAQGSVAVVCSCPSDTGRDRQCPVQQAGFPGRWDVGHVFMVIQCSV